MRRPFSVAAEGEGLMNNKDTNNNHIPGAAEGGRRRRKRVSNNTQGREKKETLNIKVVGKTMVGTHQHVNNLEIRENRKGIFGNDLRT